MIDQKLEIKLIDRTENCMNPIGVMLVGWPKNIEPIPQKKIHRKEKNFNTLVHGFVL